MMTASNTMAPLSARIPGDLYLWLAQLQLEGASTTSDKLRVLLGQLKRQYDGTLDYVAARAWARDMSCGLRDALVRIEGHSGRHSEVLALLLDNLTACLALVVSSAPIDVAEGAKLEDLLVRRVFAMTDSLFRQGLTSSASAFDPEVVRRNMAVTAELAAHFNTSGGH